MPFGRAVRSHRDATDSPSGTSLVASNKRRARESVWTPEERLFAGDLFLAIVSLCGLNSTEWNSPLDRPSPASSPDAGEPLRVCCSAVELRGHKRTIAGQRVIGLALRSLQSAVRHFSWRPAGTHAESESGRRTAQSPASRSGTCARHALLPWRSRFPWTARSQTAQASREDAERADRAFLVERSELFQG